MNWRSLLERDDHRAIAHTVDTSRGRLVFVRCRCGWRSHLRITEATCWTEHSTHRQRHHAFPEYRWTEIS